MTPAVFWEYVLSPTRSGVLTALDFVLRSSTTVSANAAGAAAGAGKVVAGSVFDQLSAAQRETLRHYLATAEPVKHLTGTSQHFLGLAVCICKLCKIFT